MPGREPLPDRTASGMADVEDSLGFKMIDEVDDVLDHTIDRIRRRRLAASAAAAMIKGYDLKRSGQVAQLSVPETGEAAKSRRKNEGRPPPANFVMELPVSDRRLRHFRPSCERPYVELGPPPRVTHNFHRSSSSSSS